MDSMVNALALAVLGANVAVIAFVAAILLVVRPWDASFRTYGFVKGMPLPLFWAMSWFYWLCDQLSSLKPAPFRVAEVAHLYTQSQVLFSLSDLRIPDALRAGGPLTGAQVAAACCPKADPEWIERLLRAAAAFGYVARARGAAASAGGGAGGKAGGGSGPPEALAAPPGDAFALNAVSALLCDGHPCSMRHFAALFKRQYDAMTHLSEGIRRRVPPFQLCHGVTEASFWDHLRGDDAYSATFDGAMRQIENVGGAAAAASARWSRFDHVVDLAGGNGQFLAALLRANGRLRGTLVDQQQQVERGRQWWEETNPDLLPRASFAAGDMFDAESLPPLAALGSRVGAGGAGKKGVSLRVAMVLRNILHDWDDASCIAILTAVRQSIRGGAGPSQDDDDEDGGRRGGRHGAGRLEQIAWRPPEVTLVVVETTISDRILRCNLKHRHSSDMTMLMMFGSGKERDERQFSALLAEAGWGLLRVTPTAGLFCILEAAPAGV